MSNVTVDYLAAKIGFYEGLSFVRNGQLNPQVWFYRTERAAFYQNDHSSRARSVWPKAVRVPFACGLTHSAHYVYQTELMGRTRQIFWVKSLRYFSDTMAVLLPCIFVTRCHIVSLIGLRRWCSFSGYDWCRFLMPILLLLCSIESCKDKTHPFRCIQLKQQGDCSHQSLEHDKMVEYCPKTCGFCGK